MLGTNGTGSVGKMQCMQMNMAKGNIIETKGIHRFDHVMQRYQIQEFLSLQCKDGNHQSRWHKR